MQVEASNNKLQTIQVRSAEIKHHISATSALSSFLRKVSSLTAFAGDSLDCTVGPVAVVLLVHADTLLQEAWQGVKAGCRAAISAAQVY